MSVQAARWALDFRARNGTEQAILMVLAYLANDDGHCWYSQGELAARACCTRRTIRNHLQNLESRKIIRRIKRWHDNGGRLPDVIVLEAFPGHKTIHPEPGSRLAGANPQVGENGGQSCPGKAIPQSRGTDFPGAGNEVPEPGEGDAALDTTIDSTDSTLLARVIAAGGEAIDVSACIQNPQSAVEVARWIEAGADPETDILPIITARSARRPPGSIYSLAYFTKAIMAAMASRKASHSRPAPGNQTGRFKPSIDPAAERPSVENPLPALASSPGLKLLRTITYEEAPKEMADPAKRALIAQAAKDIEPWLVPARPDEIDALVQDLLRRYRRRFRSEAKHNADADDWRIHLAHLPVDIVDAACAAWRAGSNKHAPTPGQFLDLANRIWNFRNGLARRAARWLADTPAP
jgi:hypothetical protein